MVCKLACICRKADRTKWVKASLSSEVAIDRFRTGLREDKKYMEHRADEECRRILSDLGTWMAWRVVEAK